MSAKRDGIPNASPCFVVVKTGVYQQDTCGPFASLLEAAIAAQGLAAADDDDYHEWCVHEMARDGLGGVLASYRKRYDGSTDRVRTGDQLEAHNEDKARERAS